MKGVRQACLDSMESTVAIVEVSVPESIPKGFFTITSASVAVIRCANEICIELHENASADFLRKLIVYSMMQKDSKKYILLPDKLTFDVGWKALQQLYVLSSILIHMIKIHCFYFFENVLTEINGAWNH